MDLITRKNKFIQQFEQIKDVNLIERFEEFLNSELNGKEQIVAYSIDGEPLTKEMYINRVKKAEASIDAGNYTTVEDLEKEVENW